MEGLFQGIVYPIPRALQLEMTRKMKNAEVFLFLFFLDKHTVPKVVSDYVGHEVELV